jgi:calmodulin-regulated spectrin-associated protein
MASQLNSVRLKLEQRRKRIEEEKRKMEMVMARQREKVGQQAFLRAVIKGVNTNTTNQPTHFFSFVV